MRINNLQWFAVQWSRKAVSVLIEKTKTAAISALSLNCPAATHVKKLNLLRDKNHRSN